MRAQAGGRDLYVGVYFWGNGSPELMLSSRDNGNWSQLGGIGTRPLAPGTTLTLTAVGSTLALAVNGAVVLSASASTLTGGAPGIMANGVATAGNWSGGNSGFQVGYQGTANAIQTYDVISPENGYGVQTLRVLRPTHPAAGVAHNFLFVLPVEAGLGDTYGDGLKTLQASDAEDQYNLTIVEPTFADEPWYANNPTDPNLQYESFMATELVPWVDQNLAATGTEQNWLIGFSKSGNGGQDLLLTYPNLFTMAASWDFPADMSSYSQFGPGPGGKLRHAGEFCGRLSADAGLYCRPQSSVPDPETDLDWGVSVFASGLVRLRCAIGIKRHPLHSGPFPVCRPPLGQRLGAGRRGRPVPGQPQPADGP